MRWGFLVLPVVASLLIAACSVDSSLTCGASCEDAAQNDGPVADAPADSSDSAIGIDASLDAPHDGPKANDASFDAPNDSPLATDGPCTTTCPSGTTCNGSFCSVPQGTSCSAAASTSGSSGDFDGTVCAGSGPTVTTTCTSSMTASASFLKFTSGGDPWNVTIKAVNGPLQIEVMSGGCSSGSACYDLASGNSTLIVVGPSTTIAIVNGNGTSCTDWQMTYVSK